MTSATKTPARPASATLARTERIAQAMFAQQAELNGYPRMAGGVVVDGELVAFQGKGATKDSMFRIASMTKSFTAALTLRLRDQGIVELDVPIARYAPEFANLAGPYGDNPPITLRHLLSMQSGLATDDPWADRHLDLSDDALDEIVAAGPLFAASTGTNFEYSNLGYAIIGRVLHRATGTRAQQMITEQLLVPLGMANTVWTEDKARPGADLVFGMRDDGITPEPRPRDGTMATMGGLWSSVSDLARWVGFFTSAYPPRSSWEDSKSNSKDYLDDILSRASRQEMQRALTFVPSSKLVAPDGGVVANINGYGLGLLMGRHDSLGEIAGHAGGLPGYGSSMRWVKGGSVGVIGLANKTYARFHVGTWRVLDALAAAGLAKRPTVELTQGVANAGKALFDVLSSWTDEKANALFTDNVAPDESFAERQVNANTLLSAHTNVRFARVEPRTLAAGALVLQSDAAEIEIPFILAPLAKNLIQAYTLPQ